MIDERGHEVDAGELIISSRDSESLLQVLQAEIVVCVSMEDAKMDMGASNWVWLLKVDVIFTEGFLSI